MDFTTINEHIFMALKTDIPKILLLLVTLNIPLNPISYFCLHLIGTLITFSGSTFQIIFDINLLKEEEGAGGVTTSLKNLWPSGSGW